MLKNFISIISFCLLSGCAAFPHTPLTDQNSRSIKTVYVDPQMKKPDTLFILDKQQKYQMIGGVVGAAEGAEEDRKLGMDIKEEAEKNHINIEKIIYAQWIKQLNAGSKFKLSNKPGDTSLITEIRAYGITPPYVLSSTFKPSLNIKAKLVHNGTIIWEYYDFTLPLSKGLPQYTIDQIRNDPHKLYEMWNKAAEKLIANLIRDLNK